MCLEVNIFFLLRWNLASQSGFSLSHCGAKANLGPIRGSSKHNGNSGKVNKTVSLSEPNSYSWLIHEVGPVPKWMVHSFYSWLLQLPPPGLKWILWAAVLLGWEFTATVTNRLMFGQIPYQYKNGNLSINFLLCLSRTQATDIHVQHTQMCRAPWSFARFEVESYKSRWYWLCPCYICQLLLISSIFFLFFSALTTPPFSRLLVSFASLRYYGGAWWFLCIRLHW